jgi:hypothetical protein
MRFERTVLLAALAVSAVACSSDTNGVTNPAGPLAYIRYVEASPDTGSVDFRAVDIVENLDANNVGYGYVGAYHGVQPGNRHFKVFVDLASSDINVVTQVMKDTTLTLAAGTYYTVLHTGFARTTNAPKQHLQLITDSPASPSSSQFALRTFLASPGALGAVDVYTTTDTTSALSGSPTYPNVAYLTPSAYSNFGTAASMFLRITQPASTTVLANSRILQGAPANGVTSPIPGTSIGGSVLTAFIFAPNDTVSANVCTATAPGCKVAKFTRPVVVYAIDKRP